MEEIIVTGAQAITPAMFNSFISFVDRGEATTRAYTKNLRQFAAWMYYTGTQQPQRADIISYREYLSGEHEAIRLAPESAAGWTYQRDPAGDPIITICKPNTVALYLRSVCQFFRWTAAEGLYPNVADGVHAPKVDHNSHKRDALTPKQALKVEQSIEARANARTEAQADKEKDTAGRIQRSTEQGKRLFAMYVLTVNAGLRCIELHRANVKDIEIKDGQAILYIWGKGRTEPDQRKPLAPEVYQAIREYLDSRTDHYTGSSPLFVSTGNRSGGKRIAETTISKMLKGALQGAGYDSERLVAHSIRHTTGTTAQEITGNIYMTQKYMRHQDPRTTEIYVHDGEKEQQEAAGLAQEIYNRYHNKEARTEREQLEQALNALTPAQIAALTGMARAMA